MIAHQTQVSVNYRARDHSQLDQVHGHGNGTVNGISTDNNIAVGVPIAYRVVIPMAYRVIIVNGNAVAFDNNRHTNDNVDIAIGDRVVNVNGHGQDQGGATNTLINRYTILTAAIAVVIGGEGGMLVIVLALVLAVGYRVWRRRWCQRALE